MTLSRKRIARAHFEYHIYIRIVSLVSLVLVQGAAGWCQTPSQLSPELRERVEALKVEAQTATDSAEVLHRRLRTLWEWSNACSLAGVVLQQDYPMGVANYNRILQNPSAPARALGEARAFIAHFTRELQIKDEQPGAIGTLAFSDSGPFQAGDFITIDQTYTVGDMPMAPGGGIFLVQSTRWSRRGSSATTFSERDTAGNLVLQGGNPAADNYVTIQCSNREARFDVAQPSATWRSFNAVPAIFFQLEGTSLKKGDTITLTFGDVSGGSRGMRLQHWSNDRVLLPVYLDLEGKGQLMTPTWPSFEVAGQSAVKFVNGIVTPSIVTPGERFELAVRSEDAYKNPTGGPAPAYEVLLNGKPFASVAENGGAVTVLDNLQIATPGVYRFIIQSMDKTLSARSNPLWVTKNPLHRIYWGDTHGHSGFADGQGSPDGYYRFARDIARLDFVTLSEHGSWTDDYEWQTLQRMTEKYLMPGKFTTILGYEWTANYRFGGHHNVYFRDTKDRKRVTRQQVTNLDELYAGLREVNKPEDVLIIPHAHQPGDWSKNDGAMERLVEIASGHGVFEWYGNRYLQNGYQVGFVGASDDHTGHPGYIGMIHVQAAGLAAVLAPENTSAALFSALRDRATYATTGERIILDATLNGGRMGQRLADAETRKIRCRAMGTEPIETIDLIKNGNVVYTRRYFTSKVESRVRIQILFESSSEVFRYTQPRGPRAWRGAVEVRGAQLADFREPRYTNPTRYLFERDAGDSNRLRFDLNTRGRGKGLILELDKATEATQITVQLEATRQGNRSRTEASEVTIRLGQLLQGPFVRNLEAGRNVDRMLFQLVPGDAALDQEFEYVDRDDPKSGDYYYLRIRQVDGAMAWSSPFWVGGTAKLYSAKDAGTSSEDIE